LRNRSADGHYHIEEEEEEEEEELYVVL